MSPPKKISSGLIHTKTEGRNLGTLGSCSFIPLHKCEQSFQHDFIWRLVAHDKYNFFLSWLENLKLIDFPWTKKLRQKISENKRTFTKQKIIFETNFFWSIWEIGFYFLALNDFRDLLKVSLRKLNLKYSELDLFFFIPLPSSGDCSPVSGPTTWLMFATPVRGLEL